MKTEKNLVFIEAKDGKPNYWQTEVTLNYRRVRRFAGYTKEEAKTFLAKLRVAAKEGKLKELINPQPKGDAFDTYARGLLDSAEWKAKRSASRNEISLKHLNRAFKDMRLAEINPGLVRKYVTERKEDGMSPATINRELSLLKTILYAAEADGIIGSNPIRGRRLKKLEEANSREKIILEMKLTDSHLQRLIDCAAEHFKPILEIALITGMRRGEILKMKWKDIDFRLGTIRIPKENSKSKKERIIPVDSVLYKILDSIERKAEYVFMNDWTGGRRQDIREAFTAACKRAEIPCGRKDGLTFHDLRHVAAYNLAKVTDIVTASKILGHSSIQMTMRYVHPTDTDKREAIEKVSEKLFQGRQNVVNGKSGQAQDEVVDRTLIN
jgi:integrase